MKAENKKNNSKNNLKAEIVKPYVHTTITYNERDIEKITGFSPSYTYIREGSANLNYFTDGRGNRKTPQEMKDILSKYLIDNKLVPEGVKLRPNFKSSHYFSSDEDDDGCRHSVYSTEMRIIL